mmetsp:Transcript_90786/g.160748  ORF Transcript_90786/g.160748 Transcript_90786/m.160748 type:complete len:86 (-) Transcript_90786:78-335(-)
MPVTALFRSALARGAASGLRAPVVFSQPAAPVLRSFATKSASPEVPLMHYTATQQATSSINHRIFYVNWVLMFALVDIGNAMLDV